MSKFSKYLIVPDDKPYNPKVDLVAFGWLVLLAIWATIMFSCNPTTHAYKAIEKHEPKKPKDSARLLKRATPLLKTPAPIIKQGKTIVRTVKVPEKIKVLDTAKLRAATDSVISQYTKDGIAITKDCEQSVKQALDKGVKQGYQLAIHDMGDLTFEDKAPDTIYRESDSLAAVLALTVIERNKAQGEVIKQTAQKSTYRGLFWVLLAALIVSGALNIKQLLSAKSVVSKLPEL